MNKADIVVHCTSLEEALAVCRVSTNTILNQACIERFNYTYPKYGHLDFVFEGQFACTWGDYNDIIFLELAGNNLPIVSGWEFLGESPEVFTSDISLESLLAGGVE